MSEVIMINHEDLSKLLDQYVILHRLYYDQAVQLIRDRTTVLKENDRVIAFAVDGFTSKSYVVHVKERKDAITLLEQALYKCESGAVANELLKSQRCALVTFNKLLFDDASFSFLNPFLVGITETQQFPTDAENQTTILAWFDLLTERLTESAYKIWKCNRCNTIMRKKRECEKNHQLCIKCSHLRGLPDDIVAKPENYVDHNMKSKYCILCADPKRKREEEIDALKKKIFITSATLNDDIQKLMKLSGEK
jgi:hypothetical protein